MCHRSAQSLGNLVHFPSLEQNLYTKFTQFWGILGHLDGANKLHVSSKKITLVSFNLIYYLLKSLTRSNSIVCILSFYSGQSRHYENTDAYTQSIRHRSRLRFELIHGIVGNATVYTKVALLVTSYTFLIIFNMHILHVLHDINTTYLYSLCL